MPKMIHKLEVTDRFYGRPLLVDETFALYLNQKYGEKITYDVDSGAEMASWYNDASHVAVASPDGLAHIHVSGSLLAGIDFGITGWFTGYTYISEAIRAAEANDTVKGIVIHISSPGGEVSGCFECADVIASAEKPTIAVVESYAHSAAYALASAADSIVMPKTGSVGSVGVVTLHVDYSEAMDKMGVKPTFIFAGKHKVDGNPYEPMSKEVKSDVQERINSLYNIFVTTAAENRGLEEQVIRDTEARTYGADKALSLGLVDAITSPEGAVEAFRGELIGSNNSTGDISMSEKDKGAEATTEAPSVDTSAITAEARSEERLRVSAITNSEEATGRESLANHLAFETDMSSEGAIKILAASPKDSDAKATSTDKDSFAEAMSSGDNPDVGADENAETNGEKATQADQMFAAFDNATGRKAK